MRTIKLVLEDGSEITISSDYIEKYVHRVIGESVALSTDVNLESTPRVKRKYTFKQSPKIITESIIPQRNGFGNMIKHEEVEDIEDVTPEYTGVAYRKKKKHFYHGGEAGIRDYVEKEGQKIEKDILNPNLTLNVVATKHLLGINTLYKYFEPVIVKRMKLYPFLKRGKRLKEMLVR